MKPLKFAVPMAFALVSAVSVHAQATPGDLIVGFEAVSGTGAATNLEVDLGPVTDFINPSHGFGEYSLVNLGADLSAAYGANWATDSALYYGVVGAVNIGLLNPLSSQGIENKTIWGTNNSGSLYVSPINNNGTIGSVLPMYAGTTGSFGGADTTILSDLSSQSNQLTGAAPVGLSQSISNGGSFSAQDASGGFSIGGANDSTFLTAVNSTANLSGVALDQLTNFNTGIEPAAALNGTFTLTSTGILEFGAIPEPSTYAEVLGVASILLVIARRQKWVLGRVR